MSKELDYIADLERENRLLGERCTQLLKDKGELTDLIADIKANCDLAIEGRDIKIKELEQENAELKETLKTYNGCGDWDNDFHTCRVYLQHEELQMYINQLTKATDLLKKFIETSNPIYFDEDRQKVKVDAEQFLKEVEKGDRKMKDEELFKAWKSEQYKDQSDEERFEFVEHLHTFPKYFEKTFLAGLKAGRPQWHDLRENPNDLPKDTDSLYLVRVYSWDFGLSHLYKKYGMYIPTVCEWSGEYFKALNDMAYSNARNIKSCIAWCEIPTFDKE